jgi:hypothetical protein
MITQRGINCKSVMSSRQGREVSESKTLPSPAFWTNRPCFSACARHEAKGLRNHQNPATLPAVGNCE